ncbi:MAG: PKD domain-containing protein, partial [Bacteroidia bacterium]|nr:PKD domain-containing protein [Bacteroidia bacterium]
MRKIIIASLLVNIFFGIITLKAQNNCSCWQTVDTSSGWHVVPFAWDSDGNYAPSPPLYRNDDGVTNAIKLPFNFCYWGKPIDSVFINNNGDISFHQAYSSYLPAAFPLVGWQMIAPFWADVDTRNALSGVVYYKITPTYMIVQWDTVGYFGQHADKRNSFQVIISNGSDPIIPNGNNVELCYGTMQWTTGDASNGINGFDGSPADPATVGANAGDGINYIQFGLFGIPGNSYIGQYPPPPYDGVSWLDTKSFIFNVCNNNTPPIVSGISPCDTLIVCMGDTLDYQILFLSPKQNDTAKSGLTPPVLPGVSIIRNVPGTTDSILLQIVGNGLNYGYHIIKLYGYISNVNPHDTSWAQFVLEVDSNAVGKIVASADTICKGDSVKLKAVANVNTYLWSNGKTTDSIEVAPLVTTTYSLHIAKGRCDHDIPITIVVVNGITGSFTPAPNPQCVGQQVNFTNNTVGANSYRWNFGDPSSGPADSSALQNPVHTYDSAATYTVTLIAKNNGGSCNVDTVVKTVTIVAPPQPVISGNDSVCAGGNTVLTASGGYVSYAWNNGATTSSI